MPEDEQIIREPAGYRPGSAKVEMDVPILFAGVETMSSRRGREAGARFVSVDVGSNTVRALAVTLDGKGVLHCFHARQTMTALGRGLSVTRCLDPRAIGETVDFIAEFLEEAGSVDSVFAVATASAREADNADDLQEALEQRAGIRVQVISAREEARLAFRGALVALPTDVADEAAVADIGGRSTELVRRAAAGLTSVSLRLGARSLTETSLRSDPPSPDEAEEARGAAAAHLRSACSVFHGVSALVASGGTASSAALLTGGKWLLPAEELQELCCRLCAMPEEARRSAMPFDPPRAEIICGGLLILEAVLSTSGLAQIHLSPGGVREGLLLERTGACSLDFRTPEALLGLS